MVWTKVFTIGKPVIRIQSVKIHTTKSCLPLLFQEIKESVKYRELTNSIVCKVPHTALSISQAFNLHENALLLPVYFRTSHQLGGIGIGVLVAELKLEQELDTTRISATLPIESWLHNSSTASVTAFTRAYLGNPLTVAAFGASGISLCPPLQKVRTYVWSKGHLLADYP